MGHQDVEVEHVQEGKLGVVPETAYGLSRGRRQGAVAPELEDVVERVSLHQGRPG